MAVVYSILAFLIGLLVGWLVWGRRGSSAAAAPASAPAEPAETVPVAEPAVTAPVAVAEPAVTAPVAVAEPAVTDEPVVADEPAAEPKPHLSFGREAEEAEPEPRPHYSGGAVEDEPVAAEPVAKPEPIAEPAPVAEPEPIAAPAPVVAEAEPVTIATTLDAEPPAATVVPAQRNGVAGDDLKRIEGIGPKMAAALNAAGITTFEELAGTDEATIRSAIAKAGMRFSPTLVTWPRQARLLADGDLAGFTALTRTLKGAKA